MRLIEDIGIYKSCSYIELLFLFLFAFASILIVLLSLTPISAGISLITSGILSLVFLSILASVYRNKKRNAPERFHMKKIAIIFNGLFGIKIHNSNTFSSFSHK